MEKRDGTRYSEAAIDDPPAKWNAADRSSDEGERKNACAGDKAENDDPFVADWIEVGSDKRGSDDEMSKREPVSAVGKKRIALVGFGERIVNACNPAKQMDMLRCCAQCRGLKNGLHPMKFCLQRKCGDPTKNKTGYEQRKPKTNRA